MKITNKYGLPQVLVDFMQNDTHESKEGVYGATTLLKGEREILLKRRHDSEMEMDVSDGVWLIFGTAVHSLLEKADNSGNAETTLLCELDDGAVIGKADLFNLEEHKLIDWKTGSVWKIIHGDFSDWQKQGLIYVWLFRKNGVYLDKLEFNVMLKDWSATEKLRSGSDYPEHPFYKWGYSVTEKDLTEIEDYIKNKLKSLKSLINVADDDLPQCSAEERWAKPDTWAVVKDGNKKALRVLYSEEEARAILQAGQHIEFRQGESAKCKNYCFCKDFCRYYKEEFEKGEENERISEN